MEIDGTPDVAFKAGVEQSGGVLECGTFGECHLHDALVGLAAADDAIVRPHRNAAPLPLLGHLWVRLPDQRADMRERSAPPVTQFPDPRVDQPGRGVAL